MIWWREEEAEREARELQPTPRYESAAITITYKFRRFFLPAATQKMAIPPADCAR
jgi:hypothetical protein